MGFESAAAAARRGADVILVAGPTTLETPKDVFRVDVVTAAQMKESIDSYRGADFIFMVAAVADFRPKDVSSSKGRKEGGIDEIVLERTEDILASLGTNKTDKQSLIGFALETDNALENARRKLKKKNLDWIVLNNLSDEGAGFGTETNAVTILGSDGTETALPLMAKREVAEALLDHVTGT